MKIPKTHTNKYWEDILLALIGEQFTCENEINGVVLSVKPNFDSIFVWNKSGKDQEKIAQIKEDIERIVKIDESTMKIEYENFAEVLSRPKPERRPETFARNKAPTTNNEEGNEQHGRNGFEKQHISRGGGFSQGRGRGRGGYAQ